MEIPTTHRPDRRNFLKTISLAGGGICIAVYLPGCTNAPEPEPLPPVDLPFTPFVKIDPAGRFILLAKNPEIGQGVKVALPMIIAEEMAVPWASVSVEQADFHEKYDGQWAGGSLAVRVNWTAMRKAGAMVRTVFLEAGARKMGVDPAQCTAQEGRVIHTPDNRAVSYFDLLDLLAEIPAPDPEQVQLKSSDAFQIIGSSISDPDLKDMVTGQLRYVSDLTLPDMLYATVVKPPSLSARVAGFDREQALALPGIREAFILDNEEYGGRLLRPNSPNFRSGVVLVGDSTWAVLSNREKLRIEWETPEGPPIRSADILDENAIRNPATVRKDGDFRKAANRSAGTLTAQYKVPLLAHVPMEPMNCLARATLETCELWAPTQNPGSIAGALTEVLGYAPEQITIHTPRMGGGFGRRYYVDYAIEAVAVSRKVNRPVKVIWTREDDVQNDFYRPAGVHRLQACWDDAGQFSGWNHLMSNASRNTYLGRDGNPWGTELDEYEFPAGLISNLHFQYQEIKADIPLGQWRAVSHSSNAFAVLSFLDELAAAMSTDTVQVYHKLLDGKGMAPVTGRFQLDTDRVLAVLQRVTQLAGWGGPSQPGTGKGIAAGYFQGAFVAEVVEVQVDEENRLTVPRIWAAVDCGVVVNPKGALAQVEGAILEGLCAAFYGKITVEDGVVQQSNFHDYRWIRIGQAPDIEIEFIKNDHPPGGLGEPPLPPVAPALCNAVFAATGRRIRELPLADQGFIV